MSTWKTEIRETLKLGIPMAFAQLSQTLMSTTDVALVGRLRGDALAAMAVGHACYGLVLTLGIGFVAAVGPMVSQAHGAKNNDAIERTIAVGTIVSLALAFVAWPLLYQVPLLFEALEYSTELNQLASAYTRAAMLGIPFALFFFVQKNYLDSISRPNWPLFVALVGVLVNGAADYALMYGEFGAPELGVQGTGLATSVVNLFMALALLPFSWNSRFTRALKSNLKESWREFREVGLPIAGSLGVEVGLFVVGALLMGRLGSDEAAAHQIVLVCAASTFMVPLGISFAGSTRVGQAIGRKDFAAVKPAGLSAMFVGTAFMVCSAIMFALFPEPLVELFWDPGIEKSEQIKTFAVELILIAGAFQVVDGLQVTAVGALRGMKDVRVPLLIGALSYWLVGLGAASYLSFYTSLRHRGMWLGFFLALTVAAVTLSSRFWSLSSKLAQDPELQKRVTTEGAKA